MTTTNGDPANAAFYVVGSATRATRIQLNSNTQVAGTCEQNFVIYAPLSDVDFDSNSTYCGAIAAKSIHMDSNSKLFGTIFAPSAEITIDSNFELFGSLIARRVDLDSNCRIHFDELLATQSEDAEAVYESLCWRLISQP